MTASRTNWLIRGAFCCLIAWHRRRSFRSQPVQAATVTRLYVEPFTIKAGSEKLREDVIAELRKLNPVLLVPNESGADAILGGGGEIWIKGYLSLNPRSGRLPSNGTPVYGGFLSVELRDAKGETLWSYLATPGAPSGDVSKTSPSRSRNALSKSCKEATRHPEWLPPPQPMATLHGAGATFPYPVYANGSLTTGARIPTSRSLTNRSVRRRGFADCLPAMWISELRIVRKRSASLPPARRASIYSSRLWLARWFRS